MSINKTQRLSNLLTGKTLKNAAATRTKEAYCNCHLRNDELDSVQHLFERPANRSNKKLVTAPVIVAVKSVNAYETWLEFDYPGDSSEIQYFYYGVSKTPGGSDLFSGVTFNYARQTKRISINEMGLTSLVNRVYFSVWARDLNGNFSEIVTSPPKFIVPVRLGQRTYQFNYTFATQGFDGNGNPTEGFSTIPNDIATFLNRVIPIVRSVIGPPSKNDTVTLIKDARFSGTNIYIPDEHSIHSDFLFLNPRLLVHEVVHAWKGKNILAADENWNYSPKLSGFEESMAEGLAYIIMNEYHKEFPNDTVTNPALYSSPTGSEYEFHNTHQITTEDFWSDTGGNGIALERYYQGAAAVIKMWIEDPGVFKDFYRSYYSFINRYRNETPSRDLIVSLFERVIGEVEGIDSRTWIDKQRIFDCIIEPGEKIWNRHFQRSYEVPNEYLSVNQFYYYETFSNGSDWAVLDNDTQTFVYYDKNGTPGNIKIYDFDNQLVWNQDVVIEPTINPPFAFQYGYVGVDITNINPSDSWIDTFANNAYKIQISESGLYRIEVNFEDSSQTFYKVLGDDFANLFGVYGCVLGLEKGFIRFSHNLTGPESNLVPIKNFVFRTPTLFTSVEDFTFNTKSSIPGTVTIELFDRRGVPIGTTERNIYFGDERGNQFFYLGLEDFTSNGAKPNFPQML